MKDQRLYAKFCHDMTDHPKIAILSDEAFRCLIEATLWSCKHRTDGFLSTRFASASWSLQAIDELCVNDTVNPSLTKVENGYQIHDFDAHQTTSAEIEAKKRAGQKGGIASGRSRRSKTEAKPKQNRTRKQNTEDRSNSLTTDVVREKPRTATRLPAGWTPPTDVVAQMRSDHPGVDLKTEHAKFCDYWHAKAGRDATKLDWAATWRNWIRRASEQATKNGHGLSTVDAKVLGWMTGEKT